MGAAKSISFFSIVAFCVTAPVIASPLALSTGASPTDLVQPVVPSDKDRAPTPTRGLLTEPAEIAAVQSPTIPEPATLFLLGTGLLGAGFGARRFKDRAIAREKRLSHIDDSKTLRPESSSNAHRP